MVMRGEAGAGKSALLGYVSDRVEGWHVASAVGIESEMELAYSGLHQLCGPMLDQLEHLPVPQREALETVFGLNMGPAPDRFLVGLAALTLFAAVAEKQPLVCILDDAQWLDHALAQILGFAARRLLAERIALVCAARRGSGDDVLADLPSCESAGWATPMRARCCWTTCTAPWMPRSATRSSRRATATRSRCSSCHAPGTPWTSPAGSDCPATSPSTARSNRATPAASSNFPATPRCSSSPRPQSRSGPGCLRRRRDPRPRPGCGQPCDRRRAAQGRGTCRIRSPTRPLRRLPLGSGRRPPPCPSRAGRGHRRRSGPGQVRLAPRPSDAWAP